MKALDKWVHLMIQLNMIKKNKATHALFLLVCLSQMQSHTHIYTHAVLPRALHITQFHGSLCGNLY